MLKKSFQYRIYPSRETEQKMLKTLEVCRKTYNQLREIRMTTYEVSRKGLTKFDLNKCIRFGINADIDSVHSQVLQNVSDRVAKAYANFFRRCREKKSGKNIKVGYPRFKKDYRSFTYPQGGYKLEGNRLALSKIGAVNVKIGHKQNRIKGKVKTLNIKRMPSGKWFATFCCEIEEVVKPTTNKAIVGIDVGLEKFATLSNGTTIDNPRFFVNGEKDIRKRHKSLSRKKLKSKNWYKAKHGLALAHEHIANQRWDFHHQTANTLVKKYGTISYEDLNIAGMSRHPYLAKHINDASWGSFIRTLVYKAESAGVQVVSVDSRGTSQICHRCGVKVPKTLAMRWHRCPKCGIKIGRDLNAAINIKLRGLATVGTTGSQACGDGSSVLGSENLEHSLSAKQEATQLVGW